MFHTINELAFHMFGKMYTLHRFLALNFTHNIHKALNLISNFVLMVIIIINLNSVSLT